jgi:hypothetical protein
VSPVKYKLAFYIPEDGILWRGGLLVGPPYTCRVTPGNLVRHHNLAVAHPVSVPQSSYGMLMFIIITRLSINPPPLGSVHITNHNETDVDAGRCVSCLSSKLKLVNT